ncbi:MAG: PQQ-dependent sugar dehydrogenase, partial [Chloroflexi bacterium]|nr:PQQ-dependent sugar dehydrogenase [Chloroflexota bacterium]
ILGLLWPVNASADFAVPAGFVDQPVISGVPAPTAIDWLPNGELLIATQGGVLFRWNGAGSAQAVLNLSGRVCATGEMGLLGLAVDPAFSGNGFIYLYYTRAGAGGECDPANRANRVSRFTVGTTGAITNETVLIDNIAAPGSNHNAGDLQFDVNGLLYVSVGDGGSTPDTARRLNTLNGKILRIARHGGIPAGNPFQGLGTVQCAATGAAPNAVLPSQNQNQQPGQVQTEQEQDQQKKKKKNKRGGKHKKGNNSKKKKRADRRAEKQKRRQARRGTDQPIDQPIDQPVNQPIDQPVNQPGPVGPPPVDPGPGGASLICQEIYATGLRNPFRIAFDPDDASGQQFFINDVGGGAWEEINAGAPGADYGWNIREGPCVLGSTTDCPQPSGFVEPIHAYQHQSGCRTITGGAFVPDSSNWPDHFDNDYLFADLACRTIFALDTGSGTAAPFATGSGAIHMKFGSDGALYFTTYEGGGQVRRIVRQ